MPKALLLCLLLLQIKTSSPFKGSGLIADPKECDGSLRIYPRDLNWETGFSTCNHTPYKILRSGKEGQWVYQLTQKNKNCLFSVLVVQRDNDDKYFWNVSGYASVASWRRSSADNEFIFDCRMY
jgi:hypothetical protein